MKKIVFTGGPSGGKTSIIEILQRDLGSRVATVPEAATILYEGGFPRLPSKAGRRCVQRAVYYVQGELETLYQQTYRVMALLCDRGALDGPAYWPAGQPAFLRSVGSTFRKEAARYDVVFHLRTPRKTGYKQGGTRIEAQAEALRIDRRIEAAWRGHPHRHVIEDTDDFLLKVRRVRSILETELPQLFKK
jgi:predicted ATPase